MQLVQLMARTPAGSWPGCKTFGVRDFFEGMRLRPESLNHATQAINVTLQDLGITDLKLESITREPTANPDVDTYNLTLIDPTDPSRKYSTRLGRRD